MATVRATESMSLHRVYNLQKNSKFIILTYTIYNLSSEESLENV